jgi:PleD family two-component response regulator
MFTQAEVQRVVIVNGNIDALDLVEAALDAGHYDVVFVESCSHAYSQIKRVQPNLVILCLRIEDAESFRVLSMLKLDPDTRGIPVLTYTIEYEGQDAAFEVPERADDMVVPVPALRMN